MFLAKANPFYSKALKREDITVGLEALYVDVNIPFVSKFVFLSLPNQQGNWYYAKVKHENRCSEEEVPLNLYGVSPDGNGDWDEMTFVVGMSEEKQLYDWLDREKDMIRRSRIHIAKENNEYDDSEEDGVDSGS